MTSPIRPAQPRRTSRLRAFIRRGAPRRGGVRTRILLTCGGGAMLLSGVLFFLTYTLTRSNLRDREGELGLSDQLITETLGSVRASLVLATIITVLVGLILGIVSSERVVRPLAGAADAARASADGRLDTRLEPTDDPDLNALTDSFNDMVARLQDRVERDARFASDVSHELRSPLMTLAASVEVLSSRRDELTERSQAALDLLVADVARFSGLVEDLLEISRYDAGAVRINHDTLRVNELVEQSVKASSLPRTPVHVDDRCHQMVLSGDRRRLARVVANLIDNARNHGGGAASVRVAPADDSASHVWICVEDTGDGVPEADRERIFERFSRGAGASKRGAGEGAGLGLALVREHVRLHGGRVWTESRHDGTPGARFVVELPCESLN
ncbi:MAG: sensor histidine kinase [Ilumatobacteraceae bacterium]